jgi:hypothetical protein
MSDWKVSGRQVTVTDDQGTVTANMTPVVICDIRIPFWRLVFHLIKYMLAIIPAFILLYLGILAIGLVIYLILQLAGVHMPPSLFQH